MTGFRKLGPSSLGVKGIVRNFLDWCHVCGERSRWHAEFFMPDNAEHEKHQDTPNTSEYLRICYGCLYAATCAIDDDSEGQAFHEAVERRLCCDDLPTVDPERYM